MTDSQVMTEKDNAVTLVALALCFGFVIGYASCQYINWKELHAKPLTWEQTITSMPPSMKRDIAIDWCAANRAVCLSAKHSPINPADGRLK